MHYRVVFSPEAEAQLEEIFVFIAQSSTPEIALDYVEDIRAECLSLCSFPNRGNLHENLQPGLRIIGMHGRVAIAFQVFAEEVLILGIHYGGRNYQSDLHRIK